MMVWKNSTSHYGLISIFLHWLIAVLVIGLFALGKYMIDLEYHDPWYHKAPDIHRSMGMLVGFLVLTHLFWRQMNVCPQTYGAPWEKFLSKRVHQLFYMLLAGIVISGYLISTADGKPVLIFDWFQIPATLTSLENQEDTAGVVHEFLANLMILLAILHALAALKHHFINKDPTLKRRLGLNHQNEE